jgi:hypothetical protein
MNGLGLDPTTVLYTNLVSALGPTLSLFMYATSLYIANHHFSLFIFTFSAASSARKLANKEPKWMPCQQERRTAEAPNFVRGVHATYTSARAPRLLSPSRRKEFNAP